MGAGQTGAQVAIQSIGMLKFDIFLSALTNGLLIGAVYALIALGLTLVYGVLHIINFAHGATLTAAMYAVFVANSICGIDPYLAIPILTPVFFLIGYATQRAIIGPASHGDDSNSLLVTLGLSIIIENALLAGFRSDTRSIDCPMPSPSSKSAHYSCPFPSSLRSSQPLPSL